MGLLDGLRQRRDERAYAEQVDAWMAAGDRNGAYLSLLWAILHGSTQAGIALQRGERYVGAVAVSLVMPKTTYVRNTYGGSTRVGEHSRAYASHSVTQGVEANAAVDTGLVHFTDRRAVFQGRMKSVEWPFNRVLSLDTTGTSLITTTIHLSGRQRSLGYAYLPSKAEGAQVMLDLAWGLYYGDETGLAQRYLARVADHLDRPPVPPDGVAPDPVVAAYQAARRTQPTPTDGGGTSPEQAAVPPAPDVAQLSLTAPDDATPQALSRDPDQEAVLALLGDDLPPVTSAPITVAGRLVPNPAAAVLRYLVEHAGTIQHYDLRAGTFEAVSAELIAATRRPWMHSRISAAEEDWFVHRAASAPWHLLPAGARLEDADATVAGGLYDAAMTVWEHFRADAPRQVAGAKISKVLYLMRPGLVPILDSRLKRSYDSPAKDAAADLKRIRPEVATSRWLFWEAIRRDVLAGNSALDDLRRVLRDAEVPGASEVVDQLSDVRLLDMLAWSGPEDDEESDDN